MKKYFIACFDLKGEIVKHFEVPEEIYIYIKQLEHYIHNPEFSNLKEIYCFRFKND